MKKYIIFLFFLVTPHFAESIDTRPEATIVYFNDFVQKAYQNIPAIQLNKLKNITGQISHARAKTKFDWFWEFRAGGFAENEFTGSLDAPFVLQQGYELHSSVNKTFANVGGRMNLDFTYRQFVAQGIVDGALEKQQFFVPVVTARYAQPMLKNFLGILDRLPLILSGLDSKITQWTVEEENAYLLANYKKVYMQWLLYDRVKDYLKESLINAEELEQMSQQQLRTGYIDAVDYQNAKILVLDIKNELLNVQTAFSNLNLQVALIVDNTNIKPDPQEWELLQMSLDQESFDAIPFTETRQAMILDFIDDKIRHSAFALQNSKLPELNFLLEVAAEVYSTNINATRPEMMIIPTYYAGLQLKYPFGNNQVSADALALRKSRQEYRYMLDKYQTEFAYKNQEKQQNLILNREKLNIYTELYDALTDRYNAQYKRYRQGRDAIASLVETKNRQLKSKIEETDMQIRLIYEFFDYQVLNNKDEISQGL